MSLRDWQMPMRELMTPMTPILTAWPVGLLRQQLATKISNTFLMISKARLLMITDPSSIPTVFPSYFPSRMSTMMAAMFLNTPMMFCQRYIFMLRGQLTTADSLLMISISPRKTRWSKRQKRRVKRFSKMVSNLRIRLGAEPITPGSSAACLRMAVLYSIVRRNLKIFLVLRICTQTLQVAPLARCSSECRVAYWTSLRICMRIRVPCLCFRFWRVVRGRYSGITSLSITLMDLIKYQALSLIDKDTLAQHFSLLPLALIDPAVREPVLPVAVLHTVFELPDVKLCGPACLVVIGGLACTVHFVVGPVSFVFIVLSPLDTVTCCHIVHEGTLEGAFNLLRSVCSFQSAVLGLLSVVELALVGEDDNAFA